MNILIYLAAIVMGITLGIIGGGGSILTVPILTELKGEPANLATAYSLIIVGISALAGAVAYIRKGQVSFRIALLFGAPAVGGVFLVRNLVVPAIPHEIFHIGSFTMTNGMAIMLVFAVIMVLASYTMIKGKNVLLSGGEGTAAAASPPAGTGVEAGDGSTLALKASGLAGFLKTGGLIMGEGLLVGGITGLVGAGGGFIIIPALVTLARIPMKLAVGTSLLIISMKSLIGVLGSMSIAGGVVQVDTGPGTTQPVEWAFLGFFSLAAIGGIIAGSALSRFIPGEKLKPGFGWFMLVMGIYIILSKLL